MARKTDLFNSNVANILLLNFWEQKFVRAIGCNGHSLLILEEKYPNYASGLKSAANSDWYVRVFCAPNAAILVVYLTAEIKISFI